MGRLIQRLPVLAFLRCFTLSLRREFPRSRIEPHLQPVQPTSTVNDPLDTRMIAQELLFGESTQLGPLLSAENINRVPHLGAIEDRCTALREIKRNVAAELIDAYVRMCRTQRIDRPQPSFVEFVLVTSTCTFIEMFEYSLERVFA
jgi:hypothetical protein